MKNKYSYVLGSFRLRNSEIIDYVSRNIVDEIDPNKRILVDTGLSYNVDHIIGNRISTKVDIMSKFGVDHISNFNEYLTTHLRLLGVDHLEYGLVHFYEPGWEDLLELLHSDERIRKVGVSNFNIDQLKEHFDKFGFYPKANQIEFSVIYHDIELVNFCKDNGIEVFGYGVLGGIHSSKLVIREYTVDELINFAMSNRVIPILRSDSIIHMNELIRAIDLSSEGNLSSEIEINTGSYSYELSENNKDPRALNKFRYDNPLCASKVEIYNGKYYIKILTLDPSNFLAYAKRKIISQKLSKENSDLLYGYDEVNREFMMITDYLLRDKYDFIDQGFKVKWTSDDTIVFIKNDVKVMINYVMVDDENRMIKSGSCHARVFRKQIEF